MYIKTCQPGILLKFSRDIEANTLCSTLSLFSKNPLRGDMRGKKADRLKSGNEAIEELNHATVVKHVLTKSSCPEPKHIDIVSKNDFLPSRSEADKILNHSSLASSSSVSYR